VPIEASTRALADSLTGRLTADALNTALAAQGLPEATITKSAEAKVAGTENLPGAGGGVVDDLVDAFKTNVAVIAAAGAAGGVVFLCCLGALFYFCVFRRRDRPTQKRSVSPTPSGSRAEPRPVAELGTMNQSGIAREPARLSAPDAPELMTPPPYYPVVTMRSPEADC
jgi:hypothetical protein